jgi:hypothetical protein
MKVGTERKTGQVRIQHFEFFQKPNRLHDLEDFLLLAQEGCSRLGARFSTLSNQNVTSIGIREKMEYLSEKLKTHVSKISLRSRARNWPYDFQR